MLKIAKYLLLVLFLMSIGTLLAEPNARAEISLSTIKQITLGSQPLDIAASPDGKEIYILLRKEILVYSVLEGRITKHFPIHQPFDRIAYSPRINALVLSSSSEKAVTIVRIENIYKINVSGSPFQGPENAPVTIAVFGDYQ